MSVSPSRPPIFRPSPLRSAAMDSSAQRHHAAQGSRLRRLRRLSTAARADRRGQHALARERRAVRRQHRHRRLSRQSRRRGAGLARDDADRGRPRRRRRGAGDRLRLDLARRRADRHRQSHRRARRGAGGAFRAGDDAPRPGANCRATLPRRICSSIRRRSAWRVSRRSISILRRSQRAPSSPTSSICRLATPLVEAARRRGLRAVGGLGMLLHQAAPGFERWFGARPTSRGVARAGGGRHPRARRGSGA